MSGASNLSRLAALMLSTAIGVTAVFLVSFYSDSSFRTTLLSKGPLNRGFVNADGLFVEPVTVNGKREYWFEPKPAGSHWVMLNKIRLSDNTFYPVYYTVKGHQVLRKNRVSNAFISHSWLDKTPLFFVVDTGATFSMLSDSGVLHSLSAPCAERIETASVDKVFTVCLAKAPSINLDGFYSLPLASREVDATSYSYAVNTAYRSNVDQGVVNLLGMNVLTQFNFTIKNDYFYFKPRQNSSFQTSPALKALGETNDIIVR